ncbi:MAG: two-component regulator propeller domain-containing protein, partial [Candidatus Poribacteria bacterium]
MPKIKTRRKTPTPRVLSLKQQNLLWDTLRQSGNLRDRTLILLVLKTGLKSAEVCKLNVADVFKDGQVIATLTVRPEMTTNGIPRRLPLGSDVRDAIEDFIRWKGQAGESLQPSAPLFCAVRTKKRLASRDFQRLLKNACANLGHQFTPNDLRHTFAAELYQKTGDLESVRVALGLRSLKPEQIAMYTSSSESGEPRVSLLHGEKESDVETSSSKLGVCRTYDVTDGLPAGVDAMLQDRHGYLWLGTNAGLCRYDGTKFITYTTADGLVGNFIVAICEDHRGRLWIGTAQDGISCYDGKEFTNYTTAHGLADNRVWCICEDRNGHLWIGTVGGGVSRFDGERFTRILANSATTTEDGLAGNNVRAICEDQQGRLWFATLDGGVSCYDGVQFTNYTKADGLPDDSVWDVCSDRQGRLWFAIGDRRLERGYGVTCFDGNNFTTYTTEHGLQSDHIWGISADREGRLWFSFIWRGRGVSCFDGERFITYTIEDGLLSNWANGVIQDREGQFWVSHWEIGLTCFDNETMQFLTEEPVRALTQDRRGRLWFSNDKNELCCLDERQQRRQPFNVPITSLLEDSLGRFWVATYGDGLFCYDFDKLNPADSADAMWEDGGGAPVARTRYTVEDGLGSNDVRELLEARDGTIWFTTLRQPSDDRPGCLCYFRGQRFSAMPIPHGKIYALIEDSLGKIWLGGVDDWGKSWGLSCYDGEKLVTYTTAQGLPHDEVYSIIEDDAGNLWMRTGQGLCCFDGKQFRAYGTEQGIPNVKRGQSAKDTKGYLWFGSIGGFYRTDGEHFQTLTTDDGLPSNHVTGLVPQPDGSMIIGTGRGIVH